MKSTKPKLRPAEGWPKGWYYSGEFDAVNIEALLAPDEFFNRVILGRNNNAQDQTPNACPASRQSRGVQPVSAQSQQTTAGRDQETEGPERSQ
jgi:hypothetical protein